MLTNEQISEIDRKLAEGISPDQIAADLGMTYGSFRNALLNSGKKWETFRRLVDTAPKDQVAGVAA